MELADDEPVLPASEENLDARVIAAAEDLLPDFDLFLVTVGVRGHKGSRVIEAFLDSINPVSVGELARFSRKLEEKVDLFITGAYRLDVSSPGADRPLSHPLQYPKHIGRKMRIRFNTEQNDIIEQLEGTLEAADEAAVTLKTKTDTVIVSHDRLIDGVVLLPW